MQPKTKFQKSIVELSDKLPGLTEDQVTYLREELFDHKATLLKSGRMSCLDCGHQWQTTDTPIANVILGAECPNCKRQLKVERTRQMVFAQSTFYQVIETFKGHQLIRLFEARKYHKAGQPMQFSHRKIYENWFTPEGQTATVGLYETSKWRDQWGGSYELRSTKASTDYTSAMKNKWIYPKKKFIPILKRNGLKRSFRDVNPHMLFLGLLNNKSPKVETLFKANQISLVNAYLSSPQKVEAVWPSIKICLRNKYVVTEASTWMDLLQLLSYFGKDLHNPKYVCPQGLNREHNKYVEKKRKLEFKKDVAQRREELDLAQIDYKKAKAAYMGLKFSDDFFQVKFIDSVEKIMKQGDVLRHCVFTNAYYKRKSLLFSVSMDKQIVATAEVSVESERIVQCRGLGNNVTKWDKQIAELINANMKTIVDRSQKPKKRKMAMAV